MSKKEIIKENIVEAPTLFVGVGGTGSGIVTRVAEMCKPGEVENINFVCLDTNVNDLTNVAKSKADIFFVQTSNTQTVGSYLDYDEDARQNWFPKNAVMYDKTVSEGAGQVRAISRLALNATIKTGAINSLYDAIDSLFRKTGKQMKQALRVVVVSTASGGTGSGIILPLCMFIRDYVNNKYPNTALIVRSMIMLPETLDSVIKSTVERESQRRNAYATIKEMNAFMIKGSGFMDLGGDLEKFRDLHVDFSIPGTNEKKSLSLLPCDFCFLMDGQNAEDTTMITIDQYKEQAAQALYQQNIGPMQKKAFSVEDNIIKELANPGNYGRNRFGGIGASVIKYPYEDLADYVAYDWAMKSIGGEGESAKWSKYDKEFETKFREGRKKGLSEEDLPKRSEVFTSKLDSSSDTFSKNIRGRYLSDANGKIKRYLNALSAEMKNVVNENSAIRSAKGGANKLAGEVDYTDPNNKGQAVDNLALLRSYEMAVKMNATKVAESRAESIFMSEDVKTINEKNPYTLEYLMTSDANGIFHPIAMRYMLYKVKEEFAKRRDTCRTTLDNQIANSLMTYSAEADLPDIFDVGSTKKAKERTIDEYCAAEKSDPGLFERIGEAKYYAPLNEWFSHYYGQINKLATTTAEYWAYKIGYDYIDEACKNFEKFFATFTDKVRELQRKQEDIVDALKFTKGDSVYPICATKEVMEELARSTASQSEEGSMLDSELNGKIFDQIKKNIAFEREYRNMDIVENDQRKDIFDTILLDYFKDSVRNTCDNIDKNIIEAIALEYRLQQRLKQRENAQSGEQVVDKVTSEECERHIREVLGIGRRLAAPGIEKIRNEESRDIMLCAYNKKLDDMRNYRVKSLVSSNSDAVDTISQYEMHFFHAMYNLTPDKLNKFAAANKTETRSRNAGLYHKAYTEYAKHIGPDSTKNMMISTHIDKRWDSIAVMPELDFDYQDRQVMKIHQAMIYGLIFNAITFRKLSTAYGGKRVYKYENSEERYLDLIVSNGTLCDEFYEILDSLYISSAIVGDIQVITEKKHAKDKVKNSNYDQTVFAKSLENFTITDLHEGTASLFEIPLFYHNSLPNSMRFTGEITAMVDAVVKTYTDELKLCEKDVDVKPKLCMILQQQFELLMANFKKYEKLRDNTIASENEVIDIIFRRIKNVLSSTPEPDDYETLLEGMKKLIQQK